MWRTIGLGVVGIFAGIVGLGIYLSDKIYLRGYHETVPPEMFDQTFSASDIEADLDFMIAKFRETHPDFDEALAPAAFQAFREEVAAKLETPKTRVEAYRILSSLNGLITDGHTTLRYPLEEWRAYQDGGGSVIPFSVQITGMDTLMVGQSLTDSFGAVSGDQIVSINGVSAEELIAFSLNGQSGENLPLRSAYAEQYFSRDLWAFGLRPPFAIVVSNEGGRQQLAHPGMSWPDYRRASRSSTQTAPYAYQSLSEKAGLLSFNDMSGSLSAFNAFLEETFAQISDDGIETLILDIRENGGGDSRFGDALHTYLSDVDYPAIERIDVQVTEDIKRYYKTLLPEGFRWLPLHRVVPILRLIQETPAGESFPFFPDAEAPQPWSKPKDDQFGGELVVLIGPKTYSSAAIFAAPLKHFGRAKFVGEETGEPLIFFGENYIFDLPNTKLQGQVSHKKFVLVGAQDERRGIAPDVSVPADTALEVALGAAKGNSAVSGATGGYGYLLSPIDTLVEQHLFDRRFLITPQWQAFRSDLETGLAQAQSPKDAVRKFEEARLKHSLFSHFELRASDDSIETMIARADEDAEKAPVATFKQIDAETGIISISSFFGAAIAEQISDAFDALAQTNVDKLFLDFRGNPGGTVAAWPVVSNLVEDPGVVGYLVANRWFDTNSSLPTADQIRNTPSPASLAPQDLAADLFADGLLVLRFEGAGNPFKGEVFILIDSNTASTAEAVTGYLQHSGRTTIIGERSAGEVLNANLFPLSDEFSLLVPVADFYLPDGTRLEGQGVAPDIVVPADYAIDCAIGTACE